MHIENQVQPTALSIFLQKDDDRVLHKPDVPHMVAQERGVFFFVVVVVVHVDALLLYVYNWGFQNCGVPLLLLRTLIGFLGRSTRAHFCSNFMAFHVDVGAEQRGQLLCQQQSSFMIVVVYKIRRKSFMRSLVDCKMGESCFCPLFNLSYTV